MDELSFSANTMACLDSRFDSIPADVQGRGVVGMGLHRWYGGEVG